MIWFLPYPNVSAYYELYVERDADMITSATQIPPQCSTVPPPQEPEAPWLPPGPIPAPTELATAHRPPVLSKLPLIRYFHIVHSSIVLGCAVEKRFRFSRNLRDRPWSVRPHTIYVNMPMFVIKMGAMLKLINKFNQSPQLQTQTQLELT